MNIIESSRQSLSPEIFNQFSTLSSGNEDSLNKAINAAITAIVAGVLNKASENNGMHAITNLLEKVRQENVCSENLLDEKIIQRGLKSLSVIFNTQEKADNLVSLVAQISGQTPKATAKILPAITMMVLKTVDEEKNANSLDMKGLALLLLEQKDPIIQTAPPGLSRFLGLTNFSSLGGSLNSYLGIPVKLGVSQPKYEMETVQTSVESAAALKEKKMRWILPLVFLLFLGYFLFKQFFR